MMVVNGNSITIIIIILTALATQEPITNELAGHFSPGANFSHNLEHSGKVAEGGGGIK